MMAANLDGHDEGYSEAMEVMLVSFRTPHFDQHTWLTLLSKI